MAVSDLWSRKMRLKCLDRTNMMPDKKVLEKYLYLKTKDNNEKIKRKISMLPILDNINETPVK